MVNNRPYDYSNLESFGVSANGVDWYNFPAKSLKESYESLASDDSGRTLDGIMHIYWVQRDLRKIEIVLPPCTAEMIKTLTSIIQGKEYLIKYKSSDNPELPGNNYWTYKRVYTSNASTSMYNGVLYGGLWQDFEFHAIELGE